MVEQFAVFHGQIGQGQGRAFQQVMTLLANVLNVSRHGVILSAKGRGVFQSFFLVQVGPHLPVDLLHVVNAFFQLGGAFVLELRGVHLRRFQVLFKLPEGRFRFLLLLDQGGDLPAQSLNFVHQDAPLMNQQLHIATLFLVLGVPEKDRLLPLDQLSRTDDLVRHPGEGSHFLGVLPFLVGDLAQGVAAVVQLLFLVVQALHFFFFSDDPKQRSRLFLPGLRHEARQVQRQALHEFIQQRLSGPLAGGVGNLKGAVLPVPVHHDAVVQFHMQPGRDHAALPRCVGGAVFFPAQGPGNGVQDAGLALAVPATDHRQAALRRGDFHRPYPFYVFQFQLRNLHAFSFLSENSMGLFLSTS